MVAANGLGALGVVAMVLAFAMAAFVYFARPSRPQNRLLALLLFFEGTWVGSGHGLIYLAERMETARAWQAVDETALVMLPVLYLLFLATLDSPLVRPLRPLAVRLGLVAAGLAAEALWFARPELFIAGMERVDYAAWDVVSGPGHVAATRALGIVSLFGFAVALDAFRRSSAELARQRAKSYAVAFGTRDALLVALAFAVRPLTPLGGGSLVRSEVYLALVCVMSLAFGLLVAIGILRTQLFGIDVKLRWTVRQGTIVGAFVAVFFVVSESAAQLFTQYFDDRGDQASYLGIAAAGLLVFFLAPLNHLAEKVASAAVPVQDPKRMARKARLAMYREMAAAAWADGALTAKEWRMLEQAAARLGLSDAERRQVERDVGA